MKRQHGLVILILLLGTVCRTVYALPLCPSKPISVAFYHNGLFYHDGKGLDVDVINELQKRSQCQFNTSVMPRARIWNEIAAGRLAMSLSGIKTPARDMVVWFTPAYIFQKNYALLSPTVLKDRRTMDAFLRDPDYCWGVVRSFLHGGSLDRFIVTLRRQHRVSELPDGEAVARMLKAKWIAGMFAKPMVYRQLYAQHILSEEDHIVIVDWGEYAPLVPGSVILSKKMFSETEAKAWGALIEQMNHDGTMKRLIGKYLNKEETMAALAK